jgi:hypothetical protein
MAHEAALNTAKRVWNDNSRADRLAPADFADEGIPLASVVRMMLV